jgi:hypothetical protein
MKKHYRHENDCLNCGSELHGKYCHSCGQENLQIKESFGHMITHAVSDYFHFDHQFFHTLKPLLFSPGKLTIEYMAGRRVQYLHPVKMYIFISLVYFVVLFGAKDREVIKIDNNKPGSKKEQKARKEIAKEIKQNSALTQDQKKRALLAIEQFETKKRKDGTIDTIYTGASDNIFSRVTDTTYEQYLAKQDKLPERKKDGFLKRYYNKKAISWNQRGGESSKEMIGEAIKHNTPKLMFFLLPMFALMLKVTFYKNKKFYVEHLIFSFHLHCFLFLFLTMVMLIGLAIPDKWANIDDTLQMFATISILVYLYLSLKKVYKRSAFRTATKTFGLIMNYMLIFGISFIILAIISAIFTI